MKERRTGWRACRVGWLQSPRQTVRAPSRRCRYGSEEVIMMNLFEFPTSGPSVRGRGVGVFRSESVGLLTLSPPFLPLIPVLSTGGWRLATAFRRPFALSGYSRLPFQVIHLDHTLLDVPLVSQSGVQLGCPGSRSRLTRLAARCWVFASGLSPLASALFSWFSRTAFPGITTCRLVW